LAGEICFSWWPVVSYWFDRTRTGGIYSGIVTPSEAGGVGAAGAVIATAILGKLTWKNLVSALMTTFKVNAMIMWLGVGGVAFSSLTGITGIKDFLGNLLTGLPIGSIGILVVMLLIIFIMKCFIDSIAIIMTTIPIMMPVAINLGFDPIWFALLYTMMIIIGMLTPPFGYSLFYFKGLGHHDVSMMDVYRSAWFFVFLW
jgi:C4-dicarboxylate transporter, DctM subunit